MYNVIIVGTGREYSSYINLVKFEELKGEINVIAVASDDKFNGTLDGYQVLPKKEAFELDYDYCIVAIKNFKCFWEEAVTWSIDINKLIPLRVLSVPCFNFSKYVALKTSDLSIISCNCFAAIAYNSLGLQFLSPTILLFFSQQDFIKFANNLEYYLKQPVEYVEEGYSDNQKKFFPIGRIDDIRLNFNHYSSFEEARDCWEERKKRINLNNMLFITYGDDEKTIRDFEKIKHKNKLIFTSIKSDSSFAYHVDNNFRPNISFSTGILLNMSGFHAYPAFDLISLLSHEEDNRRLKIDI